MALQGTVSEVKESIQLSTGQTIRAEVHRNGKDHTSERELIVNTLSGKGGARCKVAVQDCDSMIELLNWLKQA